MRSTIKTPRYFDPNGSKQNILSIPVLLSLGSDEGADIFLLHLRTTAPQI